MAPISAMKILRILLLLAVPAALLAGCDPAPSESPATNGSAQVSGPATTRPAGKPGLAAPPPASPTPSTK